MTCAPTPASRSSSTGRTASPSGSSSSARWRRWPGCTTPGWSPCTTAAPSPAPTGAPTSSPTSSTAPRWRRACSAGRCPSREIRKLAAALAAALAHVHAGGFVHRDVKPANILLDHGREPRLADFGIARALDGTVATATGAVAGTAAYLAPEQVRGETVGPAADVYALGLVLIEARTGQARVPRRDGRVRHRAPLPQAGRAARAAARPGRAAARDDRPRPGRPAERGRRRRHAHGQAPAAAQAAGGPRPRRRRAARRSCWAGSPCRRTPPRRRSPSARWCPCRWTRVTKSRHEWGNCGV